MNIHRPLIPAQRRYEGVPYPLLLPATLYIQGFSPPPPAISSRYEARRCLPPLTLKLPPRTPLQSLMGKPPSYPTDRLYTGSTLDSVREI